MWGHVRADASLVALTRIVGIVGGVMLMLMLSVFVFPKSASHQACPGCQTLEQLMHDMLHQLCASASVSACKYVVAKLFTAFHALE